MLSHHAPVTQCGTEHRYLWHCSPVTPSSFVPPAPPRARRPSNLRKPRAPPGPPAVPGSPQPSQGLPAPPSPAAPSPPPARPVELAPPAAADSAPGPLLASAPLEPAARACAALRAPGLRCSGAGGEPCRAATSASDADAAGDTSSCTRLLSAAAAPAQHVTIGANFAGVAGKKLHSLTLKCVGVCKEREEMRCACFAKCDGYVT